LIILVSWYLPTITSAWDIGRYSVISAAILRGVAAAWLRASALDAEPARNVRLFMRAVVSYRITAACNDMLYLHEAAIDSPPRAHE
jgi:hypothetical protein